MPDRPACPLIQPPVIAHRGDSSRAPENTLAAFRAAKTAGATWIELDATLAACGEVIVLHDETLDRTTNGKGSAAAKPYSVLKTLDAGSWFSPAFAHETIPTLAEALGVCVEEGLGVNIEVKPAKGQEVQTAVRVLEVLSDFSVASVPVLLTSFSLTSLAAVRQQAPWLPVGLLLHEWRADWQTVCETLSCCTLHANRLIVSPGRVTQWRAAGLEVLAYTLNIPAEATKMFLWGVSAVFSDCPEKIIVETRGSVIHPQ